MFPLYHGYGSDSQQKVRNPIYFIRKAMGRVPADRAAVIVLNFDTPNILERDNRDPWFPVSDTASEKGGLTALYDVESISAQGMWDANVEPNAERDGSLASEPREVHKVIQVRGFIKAANNLALQEGINDLNYAFNPVINFLEGSSTFEHTLAPNSQPFVNVGFGVLAWYDQLQDEDLSTVDPYKLLNRFMFVRSLSLPVVSRTDMDDFNAQFSVQLLAVDPRTYEFIAPSIWNQLSDVLSPLGEGETFIRSTLPWDPFGPGWRTISGAPSSGNLSITPSNEASTYPTYPLIVMRLNGNMSTFGPDTGFANDPHTPKIPDFYRDISPNFARHIRLDAPVILSPAPGSGGGAPATVDIFIDPANRQMYVDPDSSHPQEGSLLHVFSGYSRFWYLLPKRANPITITGLPSQVTTVYIRWREAYV